MITKCNFCDYQKSTPLNQAILKILTDPQTPQEDWLIWMERLISKQILQHYQGVKIHMGRMHKGQAYVGLWPSLEYSKRERTIINRMNSKAEGGTDGNSK